MPDPPPAATVTSTRYSPAAIDFGVFTSSWKRSEDAMYRGQPGSTPSSATRTRHCGPRRANASLSRSGSPDASPSRNLTGIVEPRR